MRWLPFFIRGVAMEGYFVLIGLLGGAWILLAP